MAKKKKDIFEKNGAQPAKQPSKEAKPRPRKIGEGHLSAMARLGLKELRNAFNPSPQSVADTEYGLYGTATPSEAGQQQGFQYGGRGNDPPPPGPKGPSL